MSKVKALFGQRILVLFLLLTVLLSVPGCGVKSSGTTSPVPQVVPQREPLPTPTPRAEIPVSKAPALSFNGEVRAKEQVALSAKLAGRISEVKVGAGDQVKKKDLLVVLEHEAQDAQVKQVEASLAAAEAALKGTQAQLDLLLAGATKEQIAAAEAAVKGVEANLALLLTGATKEQIAAAEATLSAAQARVDLLLAGPKPEQLRIAEFEVEMAEQELTLTTYRTSAYSLSPALMETYMMLRLEEINSARQKVDLARQKLELLKSPPRQEELAQLKAAVDGARAQLEALKAPPRLQQVAQLQAAVDASRAQLEALKSPPRPQQVSQLEAVVAGARAQVAVVQASLQLTKAQKEEAFLYSPLEGRVAYRGLSVGALASPGMPILTIVSREMEVVIAVDEIALRQVNPGQVVSITVPANPEQVFAGKVRAIAPMANSVTRTFEVSVDPQDPKELLRPGMFAVISF